MKIATIGLIIFLVVVNFSACSKLESLGNSSSNSSSFNGVGSALLTWDANPETDILGYKIYYGTDAGNLNILIDVPVMPQPSKSIINLPSGTYYFSVTAYSSAGESPASNIVSKTVE